MKRSKKTLWIANLLALGMTLSACGSSDSNADATTSETETEEAEAEVMTDAEVTQTAGIPEDWKEVSAAGITMKIPSDMSDLTELEADDENDQMYLAYSDDELEVVMVMYNPTDAVLSAEDMSKEDLEETFLGTYDNVTITEFDNEGLFAGKYPAVYARATATDSDDDSLEMMMYVILPGDNSVALVMAMVVEGYDKDLEGNLDAWKTSLALVEEGASTSLPKSAGKSIDSTTTSNTSDNPLANSEYACMNEFFYVRVPESWADSVLTEEWTNEEGSAYYYALHEPTSYAALTDGGKLVTFALLPQTDDFDYTKYPSYDYLGTMNVMGSNFNVVALYPTDAGFTKDTQKAYTEWNEQIPNVVATFAAMDGCTFTPAK